MSYISFTPMPKDRSVEKIRSLSELYFPKSFRSLLDRPDSSPIRRRISRHKRAIVPNNGRIKLSDFLNRLYSQMTHSYRNEYIYKNTIINELWLNRHLFNSASLLREIKIGKSIADLLFINGGVSVYEIKSNLDNLDRLETQLADYQKAAERIFIVTDSKYASSLLRIYQHQPFGIVELTDKQELKVRKQALMDRSHFDHGAIFKILRKNEYLEAIKNFFGEIPEVPNTKLFKVCLDMVKEIDVVKFQKICFRAIQKRKISHPEFLLNERTPFALKYACFSLDLTDEQYLKLYDILKMRI